MKRLSLMYAGSMTAQQLLVADDAAAELERQTLEGYEVPFKVVDFGRDEHSVVLIRPSSIASLRISAVSEADDLAPVDAQVLADRMRVLGVEYASDLRDRVPHEMGALLMPDALNAMHGKPVSEAVRHKIAAALGMDEDWLL